MKKLIFTLCCLFAVIINVQAQADSTRGAGPDQYVNEGITGKLYGFGGISYTWTPTTGLSDSSIAEPYVTVSDTTTYFVSIMLADSSVVYDTVVFFVLEPFSTLATCSNLMTNGDFNTHTTSCNGAGQYNWPATQPVGYPHTLPNNWIQPTVQGTVDYFNTCSPTTPPSPRSVNVPFTFEGTMNTHSGSGMGGFIPQMKTYNSSTDYSEYWQHNLGCALLSGQNYRIQFWTGKSTSSGYGCSDIGAYLSVGAITSATNTALGVAPQVSTGSVIVGTNTATTTVGTTTVVNNIAGSWASVTANITGAGQNYITLGCFTNNPTTSLLNAGGHGWSYYFLDDVSITPLPPIITTTAVTACSGTQFQLCATGGANYTWTGPGGTVGTGSCVTVTAPTVTTTTVFTYTVTTNLTCPSACSYTSATSVTVTPLPAISVNSATICPSQTATLTATGANTYTWSPGTGLSSTTGSTVTANPSSTIVYTISGTGSNGCIGTATSTVTVLPSPSISVPNYTICNGGSAIMTASGASTYTWNPGNLTGPTVTVTPTSTTVYTITGTNGQGCIGSTTNTVTVRPLPSLTAGANPALVCTSLSTNTTALSSSTNGHQIAWTAPGSTTLSCTSCTNPTATISGYGTFTFSVTATNTVTTCTNSTVVTVSVNPTPTITVNSPSICPGSSTVLTATSNATTYTWSANAGGANTSSVSVSPSSTTVYTVTGTLNGCSNSATPTVTVLPVTTPAFTGTLCAGVAGTLTVSSGAGYTYTWSPSTGTNSVTPATGANVSVNNPGGTYTVVATNTANSCTVSNTYASNALPNVSISTAPTNSYCAYSPITVTLTASGASTYSWSTGATTSTITATPTLTTVFTATGTATSGCKNTGTTTITVVPAPTLTVSASPTVICQGSASSTLTATGATNYTWQPGGATTSSVSVSPSSTTVYTVTGATSTCTASATITLSVTAASTVAISAASYTACNYSAPGTTTVCAGAPITFTASGTGLTSFTWTPGPVTGSVVTVTPTVTTTYTVTGSGSGVCPGSTTQLVTVSTCSCSGTALPALTNTTIATGGPYVINSNYTVTGNVTLSSLDIKIGATYSITVPSGAYLRIQGSHLSACGNMWQGIDLQPGGKLDITSNSLIEDAKVAVDLNPTGAVQSAASASLTVNGAVFNCNKTSVKRNHYQNTTNSNYTTNQFHINDAVFTCRCSLPFPITTTTLTTYLNSGTVTPNPSTPDLNDYYSVSNWTSVGMKPPFPGASPSEGVYLENVGPKVAPTTLPLEYWTQVGQNTLVLFDNMLYGINALNANITATVTAYQEPKTTGSGSKSSPYVGGIGVNARNNMMDWHNGIDVKASRFIHMVRGVNSVNYYDHDVETNTIFSRISIVTYGTQPPSTPAYGSFGVYMSSPRFAEVNMRSNNVANITTGLMFTVASSSVGIGGNGQAVGPINVDNNTLRDQFTGNSYSNKYIGTAIVVDNVLTPVAGSTLTPTTGTATAISASQNTVTGCYNGIYMANHQWQRPWVNENNITMQLYPTATTVPDQYGVQHANCIYPSTYGDAIFKNTITGYFASTYTFNSSNQSTFEKKRGVWTRFSSSHYITCNDVYHTGRGFEFEGDHTVTGSIYWAKNTMNHCGEAYALTNNGKIGLQRTGTTMANDNQWLSTTNTYADTYTDANSNPTNSVLWLQGAILPMGPTTNTTAATGVAYSYPVYLVQPKTTTSYTCSTPPNNRMGNDPSVNNTNRIGNSDSIDIEFLEAIVQDSVPYLSYSSQNSFIDKNKVYRMIRANYGLASSSEILGTFYSNNSNSSYALFCSIEDSLYKGNYSYASALIDGYSPVSSIEENYKNFYRIYSNSMQGEITSADSSDLMALASSCPMLNGTVVFQARALRNSLLNGFENYEDNCPQDDGFNTEKSTSIDACSKGSLFIYPNPSNGKIYISGFAASDKLTNIEVLDVTGKVVFKQTSSALNGIIELNLMLNNGVYFIKTISNGRIGAIEKVIINK